MTNLFKNKKKLTKIIGTILIIAIALFIVFNDKASSIFNDIMDTSNSANDKNINTKKTSSKSNDGLDDLFGPVGTDYSNTNKSGKANEYSTTNSEALWLEIRDGYTDGDKAAEARKKEDERIYGK